MSVTHMAQAQGTPTVWDEPRPPPFTLRDFLIATAFHVRVVVIAALIPLCVGLAAALLTKTEYTASSLLMVLVNREVNAENITDSGPTTLSIEGLKVVEAEVQILESADVIRDTIEAIGIERLFPPVQVGGILGRLLFPAPKSPTMDRAVEQFRKNLRASDQAGSNIILVTYTSTDRDLAVEVTDQLVRSYLERRRKIYENPTATILAGEVERFKRDLRTVDQQIHDLKTRVNIIDFAQDAVLAANQVDSIIQRRRQVEERHAAVTGQLTEAKAQLKGQPDMVADFDQRSNETPNDDDRNTLTRLLVERDRILAQYAPGSPLLREVDKKIATVRATMAEKNLRMFTTSRDARNPALAYLGNMIISLQVEADALKLQIAELDKQQVVAEKRLAELRTSETELVELNRQREALNDGYREYLRRAVAANIEETAARVRSANVRVVQDANGAVVSRSMAVALFAGGIFGGLLFGAAAGAVASALRSTFIQSAETARSLNLPCLAEFPEAKDGTVGADATIGGLATALLDTEIDDKPLRVLHLLASDRDPDLPVLTRRLADEFALHRGLPTLLVDLCNEPPLPGAMGQRVDGGLMVGPTAVPRLFAVTNLHDSPLLSVRLGLAEAQEMVRELEAKYEAILFCSNPGTDSTVVQRLSLLAGANILFIHAEQTRTPAAQRMQSFVAESGGFTLGFIFYGRKYYLPNWLYRLT